LASVAVKGRRALVAGGGIGGLAAGIALRRAGFDVTVLERAARAREIGAGISIMPNGSRALAALGVSPLPAIGLKRLTLRTWRGQILSEAPVGLMQERYGSALMVVPRVQLHSLLMETLGADRVAAGAEVTGFAEGDGRVRVALSDGRILEANLLIGADGLRSAVRTQLLADGEPHYLGCTAWRATSDIAGTGVVGGEGINWWGPGGEFGALPMASLVYWFATANSPAGHDVPPSERRQDLLDRFGAWESPIPDIIATTEPGAILRNDIFDRSPARRWTRGHVALLGDAAHPMAPNVGQGACQALEDAVALGASVAGQSDLEAGLRDYERRRRRRANGFVRLSRQMSAAVQSENRLLVTVRNLGTRLAPSRLVVSQMDRTLLGG
jgi:2-polyprenyl-6-methoxyphenol hydroxylase-like FAD-dependent oxidoreductase